MWPGSSDAQDGEVRVTVGVDTHIDQHVGVALNQFGRRLGTRSVPTTPAGFATLLAWAGGFGVIERIGIEGTGSYGAPTAMTAGCDDGAASPIRSMPRQRRGPCRLAR